MAARDHHQRDVVVSSDEESTTEQLRRGPWTVEEDVLLVNYIAAHGEGRWNALARCAGLRRTGKSCRLRWLNYLRPDLRRGNMTAQEQLLILELHSRWGNRWSKIAQHLPGRTDNEIKNYWRTRVQKHARQLNCDVNSQRFKDLMRYIWMPRLIERIGGGSSGDGGVAELMSSSSSCHCAAAASSSSSASTDGTQQQLVPTPLPPPPALASAPYGNDDDTAAAAAMWTWDTAVCQQPPQQHVDCYQPTTTTTCNSWSDESLLGLSAPSGVVYADDMGMGMGMGVPDLGDTTMWGAGADDLWYTQIMGL
ncbi:hypothetical protein BS78_02G395200 [Paspalum vaginatum]|nr:hypothetical protein BS78_02G395200 [Paspalum vaginatum]